MYSAQSIALACVMYAAIKFGLPLPLKEEMFDFDMCFERYLIKKGIHNFTAHCPSPSKTETNQESRR